MINMIKIFFTSVWWDSVTGWCISTEYKKGFIPDVSHVKIYRKGKRLRMITIRETTEE
jgi:hypothetical protein